MLCRISHYNALHQCMCTYTKLKPQTCYVSTTQTSTLWKYYNNSINSKPDGYDTYPQEFEFGMELMFEIAIDNRLYINLSKVGAEYCQQSMKYVNQKYLRIRLSNKKVSDIPKDIILNLCKNVSTIGDVFTKISLLFGIKNHEMKIQRMTFQVFQHLFGAMGILNQETNQLVLDKHVNIIKQGKPNEHLIGNEQIPKKIRIRSCCSSITQHFKIYQEKTCCVTHGHSMPPNLISLLFKGYDEIIFKDLHMIRAIKEYNSDDIDKITIPIIPNDKCQSDLAIPIRNALIKYANNFAILIQSDGICVYGKDCRQANIHCETFEYFFQQVLFSRKQLAQLVIGNNSNGCGNIDRHRADYTRYKQYPLFLFKNHPFIISSRLKNKDNVVPMLKSLNWNDKNNCALLLDQKNFQENLTLLNVKHILNW